MYMFCRLIGLEYHIHIVVLNAHSYEIRTLETCDANIDMTAYYSM